MEEMGTSLNKKKLKLNKSMTLLGLITLSFSLVDKSAGIFSFKYLIRFVAIFFSFKNLKFLWFTFTFMSSLTFFTINFKRSENLRSFKLLQKPKKCWCYSHILPVRGIKKRNYKSTNPVFIMFFGSVARGRAYRNTLF